MDYPSLTRTRMRYRGPVESTKMSGSIAQIYADLSFLYKKFETIENNLMQFEQGAQEGTTEAVYENTITTRLEQVELITRRLREEIDGD